MKLPLRIRKVLLLSSLLFMCIVSGNTCPAVASAQGIALYPDHGVPGTSVGFQGVWWNLPSVVPCSVEGKPVKSDGSARCEVLPLAPFYGVSSLEPAGRFTAASVSPGQYPITVAINPSLAAVGIFTVDAITRTTTETRTLAVTIIITQIVTSVITSTAVESHGVLEYSTGPPMLVGLGGLIVVLVVVLVFIFRKAGHQPSVKACD